MKNYKTIRRLFEQTAVSTEDTAELGMQPEAPMMPMEPTPVPALPAEGESSAQADPMTMTVRDFIAKCKEVDPLVCMGIESFIDKNRQAFGGMATTTEPDLTFSTQVAQPTPQMAPAPMAPPAPAQPFSMEPQSDELNFPA